MKTFACQCFYTNLTAQKDKFVARATEEIFVGYPNGQKGFKVFYTTTREVIVTRDINFNEQIFPFQNEKFALKYLGGNDSVLLNAVFTVIYFLEIATHNPPKYF